jgi:hypothetical protein
MHTREPVRSAAAQQWLAIRTDSVALGGGCLRVRRGGSRPLPIARTCSMSVHPGMLHAHCVHRCYLWRLLRSCVPVVRSSLPASLTAPLPLAESCSP